MYLNTSYTTSKNWSKNNFTDIKLKDLQKEINFQLISYCWISKIISNLMIKKKRKEELF